MASDYLNAEKDYNYGGDDSSPEKSGLSICKQGRGDNSVAGGARLCLTLSSQSATLQSGLGLLTLPLPRCMSRIREREPAKRHFLGMEITTLNLMNMGKSLALSQLGKRRIRWSFSNGNWGAIAHINGREQSVPTALRPYPNWVNGDDDDKVIYLLATVKRLGYVYPDLVGYPWEWAWVEHSLSAIDVVPFSFISVHLEATFRVDFGTTQTGVGLSVGGGASSNTPLKQGKLLKVKKEKGVSGLIPPLDLRMHPPPSKVAELETRFSRNRGLPSSLMLKLSSSVPLAGSSTSTPSRSSVLPPRLALDKRKGTLVVEKVPSVVP
ncbi:hypothetical protein QYF36_004150 [Acer negundo]|nr:hypothetical protein QYF36_004150 [Acer negundo]